MKRKIIILVVLVCLFGIFLGVRFYLLSIQNNFGKIRVLSSPTAGIFIDNVSIGRTPYEDRFKVGEFLIKLIPEGDATATASWQGKIKVDKNALTYINRDLGSSDISSAGEVLTIVPMDQGSKSPDTGEVYVETEPNGAIVYLDNEEKGIAPLLLSEVPKGDHEVSISMPGFFRRTKKVNIITNYRVNSSFKLAIDQSQVKPLVEEKKASDSAIIGSTPVPSGKPKLTANTTALVGNKVIIKDTPTGFLRVRVEPSTDASESARVNPGSTYSLIDEKSGWFKIEYEGSKTGWISSQYAEKQ
ncbi:MAG: PEGA domain-containing protein [Candidatus Roizmanbacteria bacterium]